MSVYAELLRLAADRIVVAMPVEGPALEICTAPMPPPELIQHFNMSEASEVVALMVIQNHMEYHR